MSIDTLPFFKRNQKPRRFSLIRLPFARRTNESLSFIRLFTMKQTEVIRLQRTKRTKRTCPSMLMTVFKGHKASQKSASLFQNITALERYCCLLRAKTIRSDNGPNVNRARSIRNNNVILTEVGNFTPKMQQHYMLSLLASSQGVTLRSYN
jgi:hypothetical protein